MMAQCLPLKQLRVLLRGGAKERRQSGRSNGTNGISTCDSEWSTLVTHDLLEASQWFRRSCMAAVRATLAGEAAAAPAECACQLVHALLSGVHEHLAGLQLDAEVKALQVYGQKGTQDRELVILEATFHTSSALCGEIATRSRVAASVSLNGTVRFALVAPSPDLQRHPLVLRCDGLDLPVLPDAVEARTLMRQQLGEGLDHQSAYEWWQQNRHDRFPLQTSKFHRVVESLHEQRGMKMLGSQVNADSLWAYMHTTDLNIEAFQFHLDKRMKGGVTVTCKLRPPRTPQEAADREEVQTISRLMLNTQRSTADRLAPSGINVAAMVLGGVEADRQGASPQVVSKLLSHAQWWGAGEDGWHRWDESWLVVDKKDLLGRTVEPTGRVIWRLEGGDPARRPSSRSLAARPAPGGEARREGGTVSTWLLLLAILFSILTAVLYVRR